MRARVPDIEERLGRQVCHFMQWLRDQELYKHPGVAETVDWAQALLQLGVGELDRDTVVSTLGCILKYKGDQDKTLELDIAAALAMGAREEPPGDSLGRAN